MASKGELACVYAALILADDDIDVTADKLNAILKAAKVTFVEPYLPGLFAGALRGRNVKDLLSNVGGSAGPAAAAAAPAAAAAEPAKEEKVDKKAEKESSDSDSDMDGINLFD